MIRASVRTLGLSTLVLSTLLMICSYSHAVAQQPKAPQPQPSRGVTVAPAFSNVQIGSKQPQAEFSIGIRNDFDTPITLNASLAGLAVKQNTLTPGSDPESILNQLVSISPSFIELKPKESTNIKVTVKDSKDLSPGGHFASLLIRQISGTPRQVAIEPAVSTTLYIIKEDGAVRKLGVNSIHAQRSIFSLPKYADIDFKNQGNVAIVPRGVISVEENRNGDILAQSIINPQSLPLFQNETTKLRTDLVSFEKPWLPGRYTMKVQYSYENQSTEVDVIATTFWYIPKAYLLIPLVLLIVLCLVISKSARRRTLQVWDALCGTLTNRAFYKRWAAKRKPKKRPGVFQMSIPSTLKKYSFRKAIPITFIESSTPVKTHKMSKPKKVKNTTADKPKKRKKVVVKLED